MAYAIGPVSGCHINPAVTLGVWAAGRMPTSRVLGYIIAQLIGGILGAWILYLMATGKLAGYDVAKDGLGQDGWGEGYGGGYGMGSAILAEFLGTLIFLAAILGVTQEDGGHPATAGLAIGLTLALVHIVFINVTGVGVNPARSLGPAHLRRRQGPLAALAVPDRALRRRARRRLPLQEQAVRSLRERVANSEMANASR